MPTTLTYSPPPPQNSAECLRPYPCRYARYVETHPVPPLKGLRETRAASVSYRASVPAGHAGCGVALSYRALAPDGEIWSFPIEANPSVTPTIVHCSLYIVHCYTFSAKERDSETGLSYFGSRYYSSDLSIWLSVDPMSDKYASLSPYTYCANNPVKLVDPNGEDYEVEVNGNTITIRATYYVTKDAKEGVEMAFNYFTCQDQNLSYTMENGEVYSIRFDLKVVGDYDTWDEAYAAASKSGNNYSNVCRIDETREENALGQTEAGRVITIRPDCSIDYRTYAHEIGHTLGFSEWSFELMLSGGGRWDMGLYNEYIQQSMMRATIPTKATPTIVTSPNGHVEKTTWENIGRGYIKTN